MELKTMKTLALTGAVALGIAISGPAMAQNETVTAQLITSSAITSANVSDMDFGEWFINFAAGTPALTLTDDGTVATTQTGAIGTSQVVNITPSATEGALTVQTPAPAVLQMTPSNLIPIGDPGLTLQTVTYRTATENGTVVAAAAAGAAVPVTTTVAATDETITFGGTINITGTPVDLTHTATFDVAFAY